MIYKCDSCDYSFKSKDNALDIKGENTCPRCGGLCWPEIKEKPPRNGAARQPTGG